MEEIQANIDSIHGYLDQIRAGVHENVDPCQLKAGGGKDFDIPKRIKQLVCCMVGTMMELQDVHYHGPPIYIKDADTLSETLSREFDLRVIFDQCRQNVEWETRTYAWRDLKTTAETLLALLEEVVVAASEKEMGTLTIAV